MTLSGKVAVVTGGASGIGFGIARVLAAKGASLVLAQNDMGRADQAVAELQPGPAVALHVDVASRASVDELVRAVLERFGRIDILVNNAAVTGKAALASFLDSTPQHLDHVIDVNLKGVFHCSQAVAREMVRQGIRGSIVHISSVGAFAAQESASSYCASKAAVVSLAQSMALELAPHGIRVNCVAPGDISTPASEQIVSDLRETGGSGGYVRVTPLGRRGLPEEIGHAVAFLCSAEASFITGTTLKADGGFLAY